MLTTKMLASRWLILIILLLCGIYPLRAEIKWVDSLQVLYPEPDAIFDSLPVQFVWNTHSNFSKYTLEISVDSLFRNSHYGCRFTVSDTTFELTPEIASTNCIFPPGFRYYWRIWYSFDDSGNYKLFKSAIRHFTVLPDSPNRPFLIEPHSGAHVDSMNIRFTWSSVKDAIGYRLRIQNPALLLDTLMNDNVYIRPHLSQQGYYASVAAIDSNQTETWSKLILFSATSKDVGPPTLLLPPDSAIVNTSDIVFTWQPDDHGSGRTLHRLLIYKDSGDLNRSSVIVLDTAGLSATSFHFTTLEPNTRYYWMVHTHGTESHPMHTTSPYYTFTTGAQGAVERSGEHDFAITPNPVFQTALIQLRSKSSGYMRILIADLLGIRIKVIDNVSGPNILIDLSDISSGVYFLQVDGNGVVERKKIIKL